MQRADRIAWLRQSQLRFQQRARLLQLLVIGRRRVKKGRRPAHFAEIAAARKFENILPIGTSHDEPDELVEIRSEDSRSAFRADVQNARARKLREHAPRAVTGNSPNRVNSLYREPQRFLRIDFKFETETFTQSI